MITGIYQIRNKTTCRRYIGSAAGKYGIYGRFLGHIRDLLEKHCDNPKLQTDFDLYGLDDFVFEILEFCSPDECLTREKLYLDTQYPEYNSKRVSAIKHKLRKLPWQKSKFTPQDIQYIRESHKTQKELATDFNVVISTICKIQKNKLWKV